MNHLRPSVANKRGRGGSRPGAGAPVGNLNALKHGANSVYLQRLVQALAAHPTTREALIRLSRRRRAQKREAERMAAVILHALLDRTLHALKPVLSEAEGPVLSEVEGNNLPHSDPADTDRVLGAILQRNNQTPDTDRRNQSDGWPSSPA